uniref:Golgi-resident adenosine 3',5'-bisphosphate 3'-phosphatase n=1 Tax=Rattus norvegicus TaxID=10116 RepID=M0R7C5_RAT
MGIRLSPLGVAVFFLLGLGVLYHLYSGFLAGRFSLFGLGGEPAGGAAEVAVDGGTVDLREMLAVAVLAAERGGDEVRRVRESNVLHEKSKGKTREGAEDKMTSGDVLSNRKMFYLLKTAFPNVQDVNSQGGLGNLEYTGAGVSLTLGSSPVAAYVYKTHKSSYTVYIEEKAVGTGLCLVAIASITLTSCPVPITHQCLLPNALLLWEQTRNALHLASTFVISRPCSILCLPPPVWQSYTDRYTELNASTASMINTEEHVDASDKEVIVWNRKIPEDILKEIAAPKEVPAESVTVWIDPLDATQEYTEDLRKYVTTMVCVAVNGKPVLGVIHKPFSEYTAWAMVDSGSNVKARSSYNEKTPKIIVSRSHAGMVKQVALQTFGNQTLIIPAGGAGYKVLALLDVPDMTQEKADLYIHVTYIKKWDICAGNAILKALGGHMTTLSGEEISYTGSDGIEGGLLASIRMNHQALMLSSEVGEHSSHEGSALVTQAQKYSGVPTILTFLVIVGGHPGTTWKVQAETIGIVLAATTYGGCVYHFCVETVVFQKKLIFGSFP